MKWIMRKCARCGRYTLRHDKCPYCGGPLMVPHPPRFSPEDKYVAYRIEMKRRMGILNLDWESVYDP